MGYYIRLWNDFLRRAFKKWMKEVHFKECIGYQDDPDGFHIYTTFPGGVVGRGGENINRLREILTSDCGMQFKDKPIHVHEIGGFVKGDK